jgi:hypothetical protein
MSFKDLQPPPNQGLSEPFLSAAAVRILSTPSLRSVLSPLLTATPSSELSIPTALSRISSTPEIASALASVFETLSLPCMMKPILTLS